jgi:hypothetical protein
MDTSKIGFIIGILMLLVIYEVVMTIRDKIKKAKDTKNISQ